MEIETLIRNVKKRLLIVVGIVFLVFALVAVITLTQPLKYSVKSRLLISQNMIGVDPYTVSKSNQYLSNLFSQIVYSSSFFNLVSNAGFNIDDSYFSYDYKQQMKIWKKSITARNIGDTGILEIEVYHPNTYQAQQIALAVNQVLINQSSNYQKGGEQVFISVIDQPLTSSYPVKPNIIINAIFALFLGVVTAIFYIYLFPIKASENIKKIQLNKATLNNSKKELDEKKTNNTLPNNLPILESDNDLDIEDESPRGHIDNILR